MGLVDVTYSVPSGRRISRPAINSLVSAGGTVRRMFVTASSFDPSSESRARTTPMT